MSRKAKTLTQQLPVPQNDEELAQAVAKIGESQRAVMAIESKLAADVSSLTETAGTDAKPHQDTIDQLTRALQVYCDANRQRLTEGGKTKTVELLTGTVSWRQRPAKVNLSDKVDQIIARIEDSAYAGKFLREKVELDKEAMIKEPSLANTIKGVRVASAGEDFIVEPTTVELPAPKTPLPEVAL
jgi:phage host-nuclease inhibitor protein Gam